MSGLKATYSGSMWKYLALVLAVSKEVWSRSPLMRPATPLKSVVVTVSVPSAAARVPELRPVMSTTVTEPGCWTPSKAATLTPEPAQACCASLATATLPFLMATMSGW